MYLRCLIRDSRPLVMRTRAQFRRFKKWISWKKLTVFAILLALVLVGYILFSCSESASLKQIQNLCDLYRHGEMAGNMCRQLCTEGTFESSHCEGFYIGKTLVLMRWLQRDSELVVLKSSRTTEAWQLDASAFFGDLTSTERMLNLTKTYIVQRYRSKFKTDLSKRKEMLSYIWQQDFDEWINSGNRTKADINKRTLAGIRSIRPLAEQSEYGTMLLLKNTTYLPKLYGTCGPSYLVEYTPSLMHLGYAYFELPDVVSLLRVPWHERVRVALQLLDMLLYLESMEPPVFMCDLYPRNFGLNSRGNVVMLDSDCLEFDGIKPETVCRSDGDCSFLSCWGRCDLRTNTCIKGPINSHLEVVCKTTFISRLPMIGLLRYPPAHVTEELERLLLECSFPTHRSQTLPWKSDLVLRQKLIDVLHKSVT